VRLLAACSLGGAGHLNPLLPFMAAARQRGDEVLVIGPPALADMVERAGYPFEPGGEPPESVVAPIREQLPVAPPRQASILGNRDLFGHLATTAMLPAMRATVAGWKPDLILRDPCEYASAVVASERDVPVAQVAISLAQGEANSISVAAPALEAHRPGLVDELLAQPYLTRFPASLDPSPFPDTRRVREATGGSRPLPDWWSQSRAPLVYVTFGTVLGYMSIAADVFRTALKGVQDLDARVLLTVGHAIATEVIGPRPDTVHIEQWVDQADVLPHADVVVCHGGSGTVFGALAAGVPIVVVPVFADQFENGRRVAKAGAGLMVGSDSGPELGRRVIEDRAAPDIRKATQHILNTAGYRQQAGRIAKEMAAVPTPDEVLEALLTRTA
jgi:UDP:flavonoid glycosyltransferase YjiC (YdhE family)